MHFVKAPLEKAEAVKEKLVRKAVLDMGVKVEKDDKYIYFPVTEKIAGFTVVERDASKYKKPRTLGEALADVLSKEELDLLIKSYDIVGSIAIIDIPEELARKEQVIAQAVLAAHPHVTTVLKKAEKHGGEFRTQKLAYLAGEDTRETVVKESGTSMLVDVEQVYFSVRSSTERLRLAHLVQPDEHVLVMFSGAAPFVVILAKHSIATRIVGVEKNTIGHGYGLENLKRNKIKHAHLYNHDCADMSFLQETFDRIVMPLPASSLDFLPAALSIAKPKATLHIYIFGSEADVTLLSDKIISLCKAEGFKAVVLDVVKAGHHAPYVYRWCFDVSIRKI
jgi:tRNA (guanine37-N1)-methyltransferase